MKKIIVFEVFFSLQALKTLQITIVAIILSIFFLVKKVIEDTKLFICYPITSVS